MPSSRTSVAELRSSILARRRALSAEEIRSRSSEITRRVIDELLPKLALKSRPLAIALTRSMKDEVQTEELIAACQGSGHHVLLPRIGPALELVRLPSPPVAHDYWEVGPYGKIPQPNGRLPAVPPSELDLIFVPGVVFGEKGERIGMGAGFYDRLLPRAPGATRIALAFDFQLLSGIEQNPWDQPVHVIVTDQRVLWV